MCTLAHRDIELSNPVRGPFNAWFFRTLDGYLDRLLGDRKRRLLAELEVPLVELGPGTGANFRYYPAGTRVIGVEPNVHMHPSLQEHARRRGIELDLLSRSAAATGLPDRSVDLVVCTLVLCTVDDPAATLREVHRILRPGGRFVFVEHVAAGRHSWLEWLQRAVRIPWSWCFEGCQVTRDTRADIEAAGFSRVEVEDYHLRSPFLPFNPQIAGTAWR
jgi:SAM-dependent methyltransferase